MHLWENEGSNNVAICQSNISDAFLRPGTSSVSPVMVAAGTSDDTVLYRDWCSTKPICSIQSQNKFLLLTLHITRITLWILTENCVSFVTRFVRQLVIYLVFFATTRQSSSIFKPYALSSQYHNIYWTESLENLLLYLSGDRSTNICGNKASILFVMPLTISP